MQNSSIVRIELKRMKKKDLLDLAFQQKRDGAISEPASAAFSSNIEA